MLTRLRAAAAQARKTLLEAPFALDAPTPSRLPLIGFGAADLPRWRTQSDTSIGGFSECALEPMDDATAVWSGSLALETDAERQAGARKSDQGKTATKTGFVGMRASIAEAAPGGLHDYHGLCLRVRPDARGYIVNVRADGILEDLRTDDLYQALLQPFVPHARHVADRESPEDDFIDVRIPWGAFTLTWRGYVQGETPPAMNLNKITHVGFLLSDKLESPFRIDLAGVSAFRYDEREMMQDQHVIDAVRLNEAAGYDETM